jgi:hypothetical protein
VQYKGKASEMFQELLADIRMGVISRMFTFQPRQPQGAVASEQRTDGTAPGSGAPSGGGSSSKGAPSSGTSAPAISAPVAIMQDDPRKKKRKRH